MVCPADFRLISTVQSNRPALASGAAACALATSVPANSAMSSRYLTLLLRSQAAICWSGLLATCSVTLQSSAASSLACSGVAPWYCWGAPRGGVAGTDGVAVAFGLVGVAVGASAAGGTGRPRGGGLLLAVGLLLVLGVDEGDGEPEGRPDGVAEPDPDGVGVTGGVTGKAARTGRNSSWAVWARSLALSAFSPVTEMTRLLVPSVTTSADATPAPLTRCSRICRASFIDSLLGGRPSGVLAASVTWVPPCRSRPSLGLCVFPVKNTSAYRMARIPTSAPR